MSTERQSRKTKEDEDIPFLLLLSAGSDLPLQYCVILEFSWCRLQTNSCPAVKKNGEVPLNRLLTSIVMLSSRSCC
jgi:hypothetical protein